MNWRFTVEGPLKGYRASARRAFDPRYRAFKERVAVTALAAGFDARKFDPEQFEIYLSVFVFWRKRPRIDWKNLYGAVEDSIFKSDRWIRPGPVCGFNVNSARPTEEAEVLIEVREK